MLWRSDGHQRSLTFENLPSAERFKTLLERPDEALRVIELDEIGRHVPTVTEWLYTHVDTLTGVQPATLARYRTYVRRDIDPVFGSMPVRMKPLTPSVNQTFSSPHCLGFRCFRANGCVYSAGIT